MNAQKIVGGCMWFLALVAVYVLIMLGAIVGGYLP
jgi:hypothetical protein